MFILLHLAPSYNPILEPALEHLQVCCCGSWALRLCKAGSSARGVTFGTRIPFNGIKHPAMRNPQIELHYIGDHRGILQEAVFDDTRGYQNSHCKARIQGQAAKLLQKRA